MHDYQINSAVQKSTLYQGKFKTFRACVEQAVLDGVRLDGADLSGRNLLNAQLDGGNFSDAVFANCNLSGANTSECILTNADFSGANLYGAIFCESNLTGVNFTAALFGATDAFDSILDDCIFTTLSAFSVNFNETASMREAHFINPCGITCPMTRPPLVIHGLQHPVILLDQHIKIGHAAYAMGMSGNTPSPTGLDVMNLRLRLEQFAAFRCMDGNRDLTFHKKIY